jgi:glycerol-3-phosphate dehydrogenase
MVPSSAAAENELPTVDGGVWDLLVIGGGTAGLVGWTSQR